MHSSVWAESERIRSPVAAYCASGNAHIAGGETLDHYIINVVHQAEPRTTKRIGFRDSTGEPPEGTQHGQLTRASRIPRVAVVHDRDPASRPDCCQESPQGVIPPRDDRKAQRANRCIDFLLPI